jgi:hypothetical protein
MASTHPVTSKNFQEPIVINRKYQYEFLRNPRIDPETGLNVQIGGDRCSELTQLYGMPSMKVLRQVIDELPIEEREALERKRRLIRKNCDDANSTKESSKLKFTREFMRKPYSGKETQALVPSSHDAKPGILYHIRGRVYLNNEEIYSRAEYNWCLSNLNVIPGMHSEIHQMARNANLKSVQQLVKDDGWDPNLKTFDGDTPLHALTRGMSLKCNVDVNVDVQISIAHCLVDADCDINAINKDDKCAYDLIPVHLKTKFAFLRPVK